MLPSYAPWFTGFRRVFVFFFTTFPFHVSTIAQKQRFSTFLSIFCPFAPYVVHFLPHFVHLYYQITGSVVQLGVVQCTRHNGQNYYNIR